MRRLVLFLFPTLIVLVSVGVLGAFQRRETLRAQLGRLSRRDWVESICPDTIEVAEA
jgi:hypothetical protein